MGKSYCQGLYYKGLGNGWGASAPEGKIVKSDVSVAKNYLTEGVLQNAGKITAEIAKAKAETEFEKYRILQDRLYMSDFDKCILELEQNAKK